MYLEELYREILPKFFLQQQTLYLLQVILTTMVDLVFDRGVTDIVREIPLYFSIFEKYIGIKLFHQKPAMYGSVDIINVCNLQHTYT